MGSIFLGIQGLSTVSHAKRVSVYGIIRLMESVCLGPKVIPLSGAHCITLSVITLSGAHCTSIPL